MSELISILIPVHNTANTILEMINFIFSQTYKNIECVLVDDGSSDSELLQKKNCSVYKLS